MKKPKLRDIFRKKYRTISEIGMLFGLNAMKFGKVLKDTGLRESSGNPSAYSTQNDFSIKISPKNKPSYYMWNEEKVVNHILENTDLELVQSAYSPKIHKIIEIVKMIEDSRTPSVEGTKLEIIYYDAILEELGKSKISKDEVNHYLEQIGKPHLMLD